MITKKDISKGAIGNTHISKSAEIDPSKLKGDKVGSILIADRAGKFVPRKVRGDATLLPSGEFRISAESPAGVVTEEEVRGAGGLIGKDIKHGSNLVGERDGTPKEVNVGTGANAIPQRDSSGNLKAETADNADKLDNQDGAYYTNVDNHVYPTQTTTTSNGDETTTTSSAPKVIEFVPNTSNYPCEFSHTFGYIHDVTVFQNNSVTYEMIDAQVTATTSNVTVDVSDPSISTRIVAK